ncbi:hypothetical protein Fuma_00622 [Fuerstiella marisgermanici]|uniref:Transposase n=1 Tax=Fuerstiella marisgermanici TaxID=1891926 RepID=A0A1P8WAF0_9PLAN|nr:hypothetical protein Fuma_00622 [Fuerstiella marisgermanici]
MEVLQTDGTSIELQESSTRRGQLRGDNEPWGKSLRVRAFVGLFFATDHTLVKAAWLRAEIGYKGRCGQPT